MFVLSNLLAALAQVLSILLTVLSWAILIRAVLSWVSPDPYNPIVQILNRTTEPFLEPLRRLMPTWQIGLDLSPLIAFLLIIFLQKFLVATLVDLSVRIR